jgi:phosphohistidine phosphatase
VMKRLSLIRHSTAGWESHQRDIDRCLTEFGQLQCRQLAQKLNEINWQPDLMKVSPAKRTQMTAQIICQDVNVSISVVDEANIYEASEQSLLQVIQQTSDDCQHLVVVGHNPGISDLASLLDGDAYVSLSPCEGVILDFEVECWCDVQHGEGKTSFTLLS